MERKMSEVLTILLAFIFGGIGAFVSLRMLPLNTINSKADTIGSLYTTVEKLVKDLAVANLRIAEDEKQIEELKSKKAVILKAEFHVLLAEEPSLKETKMEYIPIVATEYL
jgi:lauroyl/myristoyl acyltransferase